MVQKKPERYTGVKYLDAWSKDFKLTRATVWKDGKKWWWKCDRKRGKSNPRASGWESTKSDAQGAVERYCDWAGEHEFW